MHAEYVRSPFCMSYEPGYIFSIRLLRWIFTLEAYLDELLTRPDGAWSKLDPAAFYERAQ